MKYNGKKVKPYKYLSILEEAFKKACFLKNDDSVQKFTEWIERNKKHGNNSIDEIKEAILFLSDS